MGKKTISILLMLLLAVASVKVSDANQILKSNVNINAENMVLIIDAGHGGEDGGAVAEDGTLEKDINLEITKKLSQIAKVNGYDVILTREVDAQIYDADSANSLRQKKVSDMKNRLNLMSTYSNALFVSIHLNKFQSESVNGAQVFYAKNVEGSKELAECIQSSIAQKIQPENDRSVKENTDSIYLLKNATVPAVIVECGFLSNKNELINLKNNEYQYKIAMSIYLGIIKYLNLTEI